MKIKALVFCAMCIALGTITSNIKLFSMPMGGSVTLLSMFFVSLAGWLYGPVLGLLTAFVHGLLQFVLKPEFLSPIQMACDYLFAFGALGLSGLFWKLKSGLLIGIGSHENGEFSVKHGISFTGLELGYLVGVTGRCVFSVIAGVAFYAEYAPEGMNPFVYSLLYNGGFIYTEALITLIILAIPAVKKGLLRVKSMA